MRIWRIFLFVMVALLARGATAQGYQWENLTPSDAIQVIREFEGDPTLKITLNKPLDRNTGEPDFFAENYLYQLSSDRYDYTVSKYTHTRITRSDHLFLFHTNDEKFYGQPYDPAALKKQVMSREAAETIARDFVQAHYPKPDILNGVHVGVDYGDYKPLVNGQRLPSFIEKYMISFWQDCGGGIRGPSFCYVDVDAIGGQIVGYIQHYYPILIPLTPQLTGEQATRFAMNTLLTAPGGEPGKVYSLRVTHPDAMGRQTLMYYLSIWGEINGQQTNHAISMDAFNGHVYGRSIIQSVHEPSKSKVVKPFVPMPKKLVVYPTLDLAFSGQKTTVLNPPLLIDNQPYLYVGYLCYGAKDVKLKYAGRDAIAIVSPERSARFSVHAAAYTLNGQTHALPARPVIVDDAAMCRCKPRRT